MATKTVGVVIGLLSCASFAGCASHRTAMQPAGAQVGSLAAAEPTGQTQQREVDRFRRWLARETSWTQRQRLDRIERDWVPRLQTLPPDERAEVAAAIEEEISSPRLDGERNRVIERVLTTDTQMAKR